MVQKRIEAIDGAISDYTLKQDIITYRSINSYALYAYIDDLADIEKLVGAEYGDNAYMSTSPTLDSPALNKDLLFTIKVSKGKGRGAYINDYNGLGEAEFLLKRNSKFKITKAFEKNGLYYVEMEMITDDQE